MGCPIGSRLPDPYPDGVDGPRSVELKRLARDLGTRVGEAIAVRRLRQQRIGKELSAPLTQDEIDWLDADLG